MGFFQKIVNTLLWGVRLGNPTQRQDYWTGVSGLPEEDYPKFILRQRKFGGYYRYPQAATLEEASPPPRITPTVISSVTPSPEDKERFVFERMKKRAEDVIQHVENQLKPYENRKTENWFDSAFEYLEGSKKKLQTAKYDWAVESAIHDAMAALIWLKTGVTGKQFIFGETTEEARKQGRSPFLVYQKTIPYWRRQAAEEYEKIHGLVPKPSPPSPISSPPPEPPQRPRTLSHELEEGGRARRLPTEPTPPPPEDMIALPRDKENFVSELMKLNVKGLIDYLEEQVKPFEEKRRHGLYASMFRSLEMAKRFLNDNKIESSVYSVTSGIMHLQTLSRLSEDELKKLEKESEFGYKIANPDAVRETATNLLEDMRKTAEEQYEKAITSEDSKRKEVAERLKNILTQRAVSYADDNLDNPNSGKEFWNYIQQNIHVFREAGVSEREINQIARYALAVHLKEKVALRELKNINQGITEAERRLNKILERISHTQDLDEIIRLGTEAQNLIASIKPIYETKLEEITNNILR